MTGKPLVLFICRNNAVRSQMAEALLRKHAGHRFAVASAGTEPTEVHPLTRHVLTEAGIDPSALSAKGTKEFLGKVAVRYAIIVCEEAEKRCPRVFPFTVQKLAWPFDDPTRVEDSTEMQLARFRRVRDEIDARLRAWLHELGPDSVIS
jgi:arsenate reductase (thioredoxin)